MGIWASFFMFKFRQNKKDCLKAIFSIDDIINTEKQGGTKTQPNLVHIYNSINTIKTLFIW